MWFLFRINQSNCGDRCTVFLFWFRSNAHKLDTLPVFDVVSIIVHLHYLQYLGVVGPCYTCMYAQARDGGEKVRGADGGAEELLDGRELGRWCFRGCLDGGWRRTGGPGRGGRECGGGAWGVGGFCPSHASLIEALAVSEEAEVRLVGGVRALEESALLMRGGVLNDVIGGHCRGGGVVLQGRDGGWDVSAVSWRDWFWTWLLCGMATGMGREAAACD